MAGGPHTQGGPGACGFAQGQCATVYEAWPFHPVGPTELLVLWPLPNCQCAVLSLIVFAPLFLPHWFPREAHLWVRGAARGVATDAQGLGVWGSDPLDSGMQRLALPEPLLPSLGPIRLVLNF